MKRIHHTPGPWIRQGQWATDRGIAECVEADGWGIIGAWIDSSNEPEDNYSLIVAAPDLLSALQGVLAMLDECPGPPIHPEEEDERVQAARAAIAKATGN